MEPAPKTTSSGGAFTPIDVDNFGLVDEDVINLWSPSPHDHDEGLLVEEILNEGHATFGWLPKVPVATAFQSPCLGQKSLFKKVLSGLHRHPSEWSFTLAHLRMPTSHTYIHKI